MVHSGNYQARMLATILILHGIFVLKSGGVDLDRTNADPITWQVCPPGRTDIREGSLATIRCEAKLESEAKGANNNYRWEFRKEAGPYSFKRLSPNRKLDYNPSGAVGDLHIRSVDRDDDGKQFLCMRGHREANKLTRCPKETTLKVFWLNPNVTVIRLQPSDRPLRQHDRVVLECSVQASEAPTNVRWFLNGKILCQNETGTSGCLQLGGDFQTPSLTQLVIANLSVQLSGVYHCYVEAAGGRVLTRNPLPVFYDGIDKIFGKPVIYARENERIVLETNSLQPKDDKMWFIFRVFGYPNTGRNVEPISKTEDDRQILAEGLELTNNRWKKDTTEMRISEGFSGTYHFYRFRVFLKDKGVLVEFLYEVVQTKNSALDGNKNFEPPVQFRPLLVPVDETFVQRVYLPYQDRTNSQEWTPMPSVSWTTPSNELVPHESASPSARIRIVRDYHLHIERTQKSDTGDYMIRLSNPAGNTEMTMRLLVTHPPVLIRESRQVTADEDTRRTVDCPYRIGDVVQQVTEFDWFKYVLNSPLPVKVATSAPSHLASSENFVANPNLEVNRETGALTFRSVSLDNAGVYACLARTTMDELGTANSKKEASSGNVTLHVVRKFTLCPNQSNKILLELHIQQSLECRWYGEFRPTMTWYVRTSQEDAFRPLTGANKPGSERPQIEVNEDGTKVTFHYVTQKMRGDYKVVADGPQGRRQQVFNVAVGAKPVFRGVLANQTVAEAGQARLDCEAEGTPKPTITWTFKRSGSGSLRQAITLSQFGPTRSNGNLVLYPNGTLVICEVSADNDGEYQCLAATEYAIVTNRQLVYLRVLDPRQPPGEKTSMMKTVIIVVSCAVLYLGLIVFLSIYCTFRMQRKRQKRSADMQLEQQQQQQHPQAPHHHQLPPMHPATAMVGGSGGGGIQLHNGYAKKLNMQPHETGGYYESTGRSIPPEYKSLLSQSTKYSPPRQTAEALEMMQPGTAAAFDCRSVNSFSGISSSLQSTYGRLHTNTPANSMIETTIERICRMHQVDRKKLQYRPGILGRGLFGAVRIGSLNGATVLVKELATDDPNHQAEFIEQVKMFSKCDHDYVTRLAGVCIDNNPLELPLMILEYCEYNNLYEVLSGLKKHGELLPEDHLLRMCLQVAQALEHFHCLGFVHGDLGCRNVLVTQEYNLKLTNLGPCLDRFTWQYAHNGSGSLLPIRWLPPETILHGQFGIKTDVWSFGVLACEIFGMGRRPFVPFAHLTDAELLQAAQKADFRPDQPDCLPRELTQVLDRCWSLSPDRRPTAGQIVAEVSELTKDMADV